MRNKIIITHPSEDHGSDLQEVIWSGQDPEFDALWISQDGKVNMVQAKLHMHGRFGKGRREHVVPALLKVPHHGREAEQNPPQAAERLLDFIPLKYREHLVGDLEELYREHLRENGLRAAQRWYWREALMSLLPIIWTVIKEVVGLAVLLKLIK